jgi:ATP-dependent helicase HrpB
LAECEALGAGRAGVLGLALLQERDVLAGGTSGEGRSDLDVRIEAVRAGRGDPARSRSVEQVARQLEGLVRAGGEGDPGALERALLAGFPDRVCRRRAPGSDRAVMVGGRGVRLHRASVVRAAPLFVALDLDDAGSEATVTLASTVEESWLAITEEVRLSFDGHQVAAVRERRHRDLVLDAHPAPLDVNDPRVTELLVASVDPAEVLVEASDLLHRLAFAARHVPALGTPDARALLGRIAPGARSLTELRERARSGVLDSLTFQERRELDRLAPAEIVVPSGKTRALTYGADPSEPPVLAVKMQELFGLATSPTVAGGRVKIRLHLLAPNGRPQQVTDDLAGFWERTWPEVRKELRGRYPKHPWPEDPLQALPTARTKAR